MNARQKVKMNDFKKIEKAIECIEDLKDSLEIYKKDKDIRELSEALDMAIKALERQPCDDCISREQAVYIASGYCAPQNIAEELRKLPLGTPQPKTGRWITKPHIYGVTFCSECGFELRINDTKYCPNCGAKMEVDSSTDSSSDSSTTIED